MNVAAKAALTQYLDDIVEPTFEEFRQNPRSLRHGNLACIVTYHAIDRVSQRPGNLRKPRTAMRSPIGLVAPTDRYGCFTRDGRSCRCIETRT